MFKIGDRVEFLIVHAPHNQRAPVPCTIMHVGATTYGAADADQNYFTSHHENFRVPQTQEPERKVIIGIAGRKRHGKDTSFAALEGFENVKFATPIKLMVRAFFAYVGFTPDEIDELVDGSRKEEPLACLGGKSSRYFQQVLGTECGRVLIWDEIWINAAKLRADQFLKVGITDLRFPNEHAAIKAWGGTTMRVVNPHVPVVKGEHPSEDLVDDLPVDFEVINDGTIEDLHTAVRAIAVSPSVVKRYVEQ